MSTVKMDSSDLPRAEPNIQANNNHIGQMPPSRKRVGFTSDSANTPENGASASRSPEDPQPDTESGGHTTPVPVRLRPDVSHEELSEEIHKAFGQPYLPKPRPAIRRTERTPPRFNLDVEHQVEDNDKTRSGIEALQRATRLSKKVGTYSASAPASRRSSIEDLMATVPPVISPSFPAPEYESEAAESTDDEAPPSEPQVKQKFLDQADQILRQHTLRKSSFLKPEDLYHSKGTSSASGRATPRNRVEIEDEHVPKPPKFRTGVLGTLLQVANATAQAPVSGSSINANPYESNHAGGSLSFSGASTMANSPYAGTSRSTSPARSGTATPTRSTKRLWHHKRGNASTSSVARLVGSSSILATTAQKDAGQEMTEVYKKKRPGMGKRTGSNNSIRSAITRMAKPSRVDQIKIKIHLAGILARQNYLRKLCKALMKFGAPTHRLEEYMAMSARVLEIEAQFLYMPGCMIIAFDDSSVHTSEVKLVRVQQGIDLGRLRDVHEIYKDVVHDRMGVEEATPRLQEIMNMKPKFNSWFRVLMYGFASATVGPFAFEARPIDLPFCFLLGCLLGWLQLIVTPSNPLVANVFEITAAVITSFLARALGSIRKDGEEIFCFSAMAQSSIALILPGFTVLSAALELQSRHIVAGSVRMVYAIIYSLFLGFGITIGTVLFGIMYKDATSATSCSGTMSTHWYYFFVIAFSLCLVIINQAKYKQIPAMLVIALIGYVVNFHSSRYFKKNAQVSNTLGALAIGVTANIQARFGRHVENWCLDFWENRLRPRWRSLRKRYYTSRGRLSKLKVEGSVYTASHSRSSSFTSEFVPHVRRAGYGLAAAAMLPAIFVQVPSGLSVSGSLVSGIASADQITHNTTTATTVTAAEASNGSLNSVALNVGFSVIQVAIGITVGLFLSALLVYPLGKRRSGLFSF